MTGTAQRGLAVPVLASKAEARLYLECTGRSALAGDDPKIVDHTPAISKSRWIVKQGMIQYVPAIHADLDAFRFSHLERLANVGVQLKFPNRVHRVCTKIPLEPRLGILKKGDAILRGWIPFATGW